MKESKWLGSLVAGKVPRLRSSTLSPVTVVLTSGDVDLPFTVLTPPSWRNVTSNVQVGVTGYVYADLRGIYFTEVKVLE